MMSRRPVQRWQIAFCPWINVNTPPFSMCGVHISGFRDLAQQLGRNKKAALLRSCMPYSDHFMSRGRILCQYSDNPLAYYIDTGDPIREYNHAERNLIYLVNRYLYLCIFSENEIPRLNPGKYTNSSDWEIFIHNIRNPIWYSIRLRRLFGHILSGGHTWNQTAITGPLATNRYEFNNIRHDLIEAITQLNNQNKVRHYYNALKTFAEGTTDRVSWLREDDIPFLWDALQQLYLAARKSPNCRKYILKAALKSTLSDSETAVTNFFRAVVGRKPRGGQICRLPFNVPYKGKIHAVTRCQQQGHVFSWLERALDDLRKARNQLTHEGMIDPETLSWPIISLAFIGSRFFSVAFKRILQWETSFFFNEYDECHVDALIALAKKSRSDICVGYDAYHAAMDRCCHAKAKDRFLRAIRRQ